MEQIGVAGKLFERLRVAGKLFEGKGANSYARSALARK